jgi:topoisomerase IA-like protein
MENIFEKPFLGKYENVPVYLNNGKFGPYLNYNGRLYSVAECFRNEEFNLKTAIKIIMIKSTKRLIKLLKNLTKN